MGDSDHGKARFARPQEGETLWFNGALVTIRIPGAWSGDAFSLAELVMPKGRATALHSDPSDETIHLLEGELLFHVDGEDRRAGVNETVAIRRGVPHAFLAVSETARFLCLNTPGTHDRFFRAAGVPATDRDFANAPPPDYERTAAAAKEAGVELLGPPPFPEGSVRLMSG
ncbi:MAG: cupin domain-containing protein [Actinomycetota bacterium]|nr:cupin domain-containing protein [Actinomycetota bacterium]